MRLAGVDECYMSVGAAGRPVAPPGVRPATLKKRS